MKNNYVRRNLTLKFQELERHFDNKLSKVKIELLQWFIGVSLFQTTALIISILIAQFSK